MIVLGLLIAAVWGASVTLLIQATIEHRRKPPPITTVSTDKFQPGRFVIRTADGTEYLLVHVMVDMQQRPVNITADFTEKESYVREHTVKRGDP